MNHRTGTIVRPTPRLLACALASCLLMTAAPAALAQSTAATVRGQATVDAAPAAQARVTATNVATGLSRSVTTSPSGSYSLAGLPPGTYTIVMDAGGQTTTRTVTLQVGQTATLDLAAGGVAETATQGPVTDVGTVTVTGTRLAETKTSEVATYITPRQIEALPQGSRNFLAFADIVPGVQFETGADGSTKLRSGGQNSNGTNVFIDGVGQKNYVLRGGISGQDSSRGNPFPQLAIGEYKVITSNYKAEYDQLSSAAITAVTRSGTNEFEGQFFWDYTSDKWRSASPSEQRNGRKIDSKEEQYGVALGGPILRDRLFFFMTYERKEFASPRDVGAQNIDPALLPAEFRTGLGTTSAPFEEDLYFGKLTWQPGDNHLFELSTKVRDEAELTNISGINTPSYGTSKDNESTRVALRYQYSNDTWLNDANLTFEDESFGPRPITFGPGFNLVDGQRRGILNVGGGQDFQDKGQEGWGFQNDLTFFGWEGHTIKMGFKYKAIDINAFEQQPFNPQYLVNLPAELAQGNTTLASFTPYEVSFGAPLPGAVDRNIQTANKQYGIYFQDDWDVTDRLTLNLGLRYDYEKTPAYENYVTPANLAAALRGWSNLDNTDYDIENYISDGSNRSTFDGAWQPRLGFSYDLTGDERHVIFGGAGRSYDRNLFDVLALEQSKSTFPRYTLRFNTAANPCTVGTNNCFDFDPSFYDPQTLYALVAANPNFGAEVNLINNKLDTPYSDQYSLGMRNAITLWGHDWNTSVAVARIESHDGILFRLGNRYPDGTFYGPGRTFGGAPFGNPIPGFGTLIVADNAIETRTNQLLLSADKPFTSESRWGVTLAYTYTDAEENRSGAADRDERYTFDYASLDDAPWVDSIGVSKHRFVGTGIVDIGAGLTFSTKLTLASPPAKDVLNCLAPVPAGIDGCGNARFEGGYFDDAKFRQWDIALEKVWDTGTDLKLRVRADVLNVTNAKNYTDFGTFRGLNGVENDSYGERTGDGIVFPTRTFKLSMGFSW